MCWRPTRCASRQTATRRPCCSPTAIRSSGARCDGGKRHYAVWRDPHPKPCYLFALVGGNLASFASDFTTASGRKVDLRIYVEPGKEDRCAWAMDCLKRSMRWDEERFGREYDLDVFNIVAVSDFNMGAMENKGLNIFNDGLVLASPETATDSTFLGHRARDRARVFPQLDRQPHHLPRLVPALPEGRADRVPRPGVRRRRAFGHRAAHQRGAGAEGARSFRRMPDRSRIPCARTATSRSTTSTRRPSTRRAPRSCA